MLYSVNFTLAQQNAFFLMLIHFLRERQRQSESGEGAEREGDTESKAGSVQAPSCQHRAGRGAQTHRL